MSVIQKTTEHTQLVDPFGSESSGIHDKCLVDMIRFCKSPSILEGHANHPIFAVDGVKQGRDTVEQGVDLIVRDMKERPSILTPDFPTGQMVVDSGQFFDGLGNGKCPC
jgi:hypothetical protein